MPQSDSDAIEFFYRKPWSDGYPVVPPTKELIASMLKGTTRDPDEQIGLVPPNFDPLTVRMVAEHAAMAGALPEYMPVILGGMDAILDERLNMHGVQTTVHGVAPLMIVNGPYGKRIGVHGGSGCFGPGFRANATIGRTVRLILFHVGGGIPSASSSSFSQPARYTFCIAENEEESPWEALSVTRGFKPDEDVVTVVQCQGPTLVHNDYTDDPERFHGVYTSAMSHLGNMNAYRTADMVIALSPETADHFVRLGFSKAAVHRLFCEKAGCRVGELKRGARWNLERLHYWQNEVDPDNDDCFVPAIQEPNRLFLLVAGGRSGAGVTAALMSGWNGTSRGVSVAYHI